MCLFVCEFCTYWDADASKNTHNVLIREDDYFQYTKYQLFIIHDLKYTYFKDIFQKNVGHYFQGKAFVKNVF